MSFTSLGSSAAVDGFTYGLAVNVDGNYLIAGSSAGSVRIKNNSTWFSRTLSGSGIASCAVSNDGSRMYAGTFSGEMYASADSGDTWTNVRNGSSRAYVACDGNGTRLIVTDGTQVFSASFVGWSSGNAAPTFTSGLNAGGAANILCCAVAKLTNGDSAVVVASDFNTNGNIYVSTNGGASFTALTNPIGTTQWYGCTVSANGNVVFGADYSGNNGLYGAPIATGGGSGWTKVHSDGEGFLSVATDTTGSLVIGGMASGNVTYSTDLVNFTKQSIPGAITTWVVDYAIAAGVGYTVASNIPIHSLAMTGTGSLLPVMTPSAPTLTSVVPGPQSLVVNWAAPSNNGGVAISGYTIKETTDKFAPITAAANATTYTISGLIADTQYEIAVYANNSAGQSSASNLINGTPMAPATVPGAPTLTAVVRDVQSLIVSWSAPSNDGGSAITGYKIKDNFNGFATINQGTGGGLSLGALSYTITGLTGGTEYNIVVIATNSVGDSSDSNSITGTPFSPAGYVASVSAQVSNTATTLQSSGSAATVVTNLLKELTPEATAYTFRSALKNASLSDADAAAAKADYIATMRTISPTITVSSTNFAGFLGSATQIDATVTPKPITVAFPTFTGNTTIIDVSTIDTTGSSYAFFEIPKGYSMTFVNGEISKTFTNGGNVYTCAEDNTTYGVGDTMVIGNFTYKLFAIGSTGGEGGFNNGGGGAGDPYVKTVSGIDYKLPTMDAPIRFYQGVVDGKTLTVNATLKTVSSNELAAFNMRSLIELTPTIGKKRAVRVMKQLFEKEETLCFFEKVYISHGDRTMTLNVWDSKIQISSYSGVFPMKVMRNGDKVLKHTEIYSGYKGTSLEVTIGAGASVQISAFDSPIVRSGLFVNAPSMAKGNGVIVNALSKADMTLDSLEDVKPVRRVDCASRKIVKESFMDEKGTRVRNVTLLC